MKFLTLFIFSLVIITNIYSQSVPCPFVDAGPDQTFDCSQNCTNLTASYLDIRETSSYTVEGMPHTPPIAYNAPNGTGVSVNIDDRWSSVITLPFNFCFYGVTYNQLLIGSNGNLNFSLTSAGGFSNWSFTASCPSTNLVSAGNIYGIYHDIDPSVCGDIYYYVIGNAPCRQFIVSYNQICQYSCTSIKSRHMMVLNETTNYIDVYVEAKPLCSGWNSGNAIIGLQNPAGTVGITAPGRNTNPDWTVTTPEAWRFKPAGNPLYTFQWLNGTTSLGSTNTINVCPTQATTYTTEFIYTPCGSTTPVTLTDNVTVTPAPGSMQVTSVLNPSVCGQSNGSVSLTATGGSGVYQYSSDNITFGSNAVFSNLSAGQYTFYVNDDNGCSVTYPVTVLDQSTLAASFGGITNVSCFGDSDGEIIINATGGTQPYNFVLGTGSPQNNGLYNGLQAGSFAFSITDAEGCSFQLDTVLTEPDELELSFVSADTTLCNLDNGALEVASVGGTGNPIYSIDGFLTQQVSGLFSSLFSNSYLVEVQDENGCQDTLTVFVPADSSVQADLLAAIDISCNGLNDGALSVQASIGPLPYTYAINNGTPQNFSVFSNLSPGNYTITVTDNNGCQDSVQAAISEPSLLTTDATIPPTICAGDTVLLFANINGGTQPYTLIWNGNITGNSALDFPSLPTTYNLVVTDASGCTANDQVSVDVLTVPTAQALISPSTGYQPLSVVISNISINANSYQWDFGNGQTLNSVDLSAINMDYNSPGTYYINLIASNGLCFDNWIDSIIVLPYEILEVDVPNVFSPNGDGSNEGYSIITRNATAIEAVIVDRWGVKMVEIDDLSYKWDGKTPSGNEATDGVYFVKYKVTGLNNQEIQGHTFFHLIR